MARRPRAHSDARPSLSVVAPCHNEAGCLREFHHRISTVAAAIAGDDYEFILVDDRSTDGTQAILRELLDGDLRLTVINLARRHGHQLALTAGLSRARGARIVTIDSDLQDPPECIAEMWNLMDRCKADVVYGRRRERKGEGFLKRGTAAAYYWLLAHIGFADIPRDTGDFRMMTRRVVATLNKMPERHRFIRGMVSWIGLRQVPMLYDRDPRYAGRSNYSLGRMFALAFDGLTSFSIVPLRIASFCGFGLGLISLSMLGYTLVSWAFGRVRGDVETTVELPIELLLGSAQLLLIGLLGEYVGRLYLESKARPLFIIDDVLTHHDYHAARSCAFGVPAVDGDNRPLPVSGEALGT